MADYKDIIKSMSTSDMMQGINKDMLPKMPNYDFSSIDKAAESNRKARQQVGEIAKHTSSMDNNLRETKEDVSKLKDTISSLNETVRELERKLEEERTRSQSELEKEHIRASKAEQKNKWFTFLVAVFSVLFTVLMNRLF